MEEEEALFALSNGLYVLGAKENERYVGSLVDAVSQVAMGPDMIIKFRLSKQSRYRQVE